VTIRETADASHSLNAPKLGLEYATNVRRKVMPIQCGWPATDNTDCEVPQGFLASAMDMLFRSKIIFKYCNGGDQFSTSCILTYGALNLRIGH